MTKDDATKRLLARVRSIVGSNDAHPDGFMSRERILRELRDLLRDLDAAEHLPATPPALPPEKDRCSWCAVPWLWS